MKVIGEGDAIPAGDIAVVLSSAAANDYARMLEDRATAIRERTGELSSVDKARVKYGASLIRVHWMYADVALGRSDLRRVCTWANGDEGFVFRDADG